MALLSSTYYKSALKDKLDKVLSSERYNFIDINKATSLDDFITLNTPAGSMVKGIANNLYGINHQGVKSYMPSNRDSNGLAFFTRPQLNLREGNVANIRQIYSLLTTNDSSIHRYVRCLLDPRLKYNEDIISPLLDNEFAFIPIFTNTLNNMSGWPDIVSPTYTSKEGVRKEQWTIVDGAVDVFESFDIDCSFRNVKDEPISIMLLTWLIYMSAVFEGLMSPYMRELLANEIDYVTRIYRLVLDESGIYVKKISATGASFPVNYAAGKFFDYTNATRYNDQTREINVRFKSVGALYNDDILIKEFNETSAIFNGEIRKLLKGQSHNLEKIPQSLLDKFNHRGYPIINEDTMELEWWINTHSSTYKKILNSLRD